MLDMGFAEDLEAILDATPDDAPDRAVLGHDAAAHRAIARRHLRDPVRITIDREPATDGRRAARAPDARTSSPARTSWPRSAACSTSRRPTAAIVFCRTRTEVDQLTETLNGRGYRAEALHGGMTQDQRDRVMARLRDGTADLLVATDVAARGLDIDQLTHVVNYDVPVRPRGLRPPHRPRRPRGPRGRGDHARRAARAPAAQDDRARRPAAKIAIEKLPTVADLRARRLELTRAALEELLVEGDDLDRYRVVVDALADEYDVVEIALAAVKLAHEASGQRDDGRDRDPRGRASRAPKTRQRQGPRRRDMTRLFIGAGRTSGVRPQDLVGAIAGESGSTGARSARSRSPTASRSSRSPTSSAEEIIAALRASTIKGKKAAVRRDRTAPPEERR